MEVKQKIRKRLVSGIPDDVYRDAKVNAARQGVTVGQYIADAIRDKNDKQEG